MSSSARLPSSWAPRWETRTNVSANARAFRLFFDDDGTTYSTATALYYDVAIAANVTSKLEFLSPLWMTNSSGNLAVRSDAASELTFTVFGIEHKD